MTSRAPARGGPGASDAPRASDASDASDAPDAPAAPGALDDAGAHDGVVALEFALHLPLLALVVVAVLSLVGVVRTSLLAQEAARVGARLAAVGNGPAAVASAVGDIAGPQAVVSTSVGGPGDLVVVEVEVPWSALGLDHQVEARSVAMVEPVVGR